MLSKKRRLKDAYIEMKIIRFLVSRHSSAVRPEEVHERHKEHPRREYEHQLKVATRRTHTARIHLRCGI